MLSEFNDQSIKIILELPTVVVAAPMLPAKNVDRSSTLVSKQGK